MKNKNTAAKQLDQIAERLMELTYDAYPGLLNGNSGLILFLAYYYKWVKQEEKILFRIEALLQRVFFQLNEYDVPGGLSSGYTGVGFVLNKLIRLGIYNPLCI